MSLILANWRHHVKQDVIYVLQCRHMRIEPRPQVTGTEIFVKIEHDVCEIRKQTDRLRDIHTHRSQYFAHLPEGEVES